MNLRNLATTNVLALLWLTAAAASARAQGPQTTTVLTASPNPGTTTGTVGLTAVISHSGAPVSEGTVAFYDGSNTISGGSFVAVSNGAARFNTQLAAGQHTLQARFSGSSNYAASTSSNYFETINLTQTTTAAANASAVYSSTNQNVPLSASVTSGGGGAVSGGSVLFAVTSGGAPIGPQVVSAVTAGAASGTFVLTAGTMPGVYPIQTSYGGSSLYAGSNDASHALTVTAPAPTATDAQGAQIIGCNRVVFTGTGFPGSAISGAFTDASGQPWPGAGAGQLTFATTCQNNAWSATLTIPAGLNGTGLTLTVSQTASGQTLAQTVASTGIAVQTTQPVAVASLGNVNGHPTVTMNGCAGEMYQLQRTISLSAPTWVTVAFAMPTACGPMQLADPDGSSRAAVFYRVLVQ